MSVTKKIFVQLQSGVWIDRDYVHRMSNCSYSQALVRIKKFQEGLISEEQLLKPPSNGGSSKNVGKDSWEGLSGADRSYNLKKITPYTSIELEYLSDKTKGLSPVQI